MTSIIYFTTVLLLHILIVIAAVRTNENYTNNDGGNSVNYIKLVPNEKYVKDSTEIFKIYCYEGAPKSIFQIWRSVHLLLLNIPTKYELFPGLNASEVSYNYKTQSMLWRPAFLYSNSDSSIDFPAFSQYCIGLSSIEQFAIQFQVRTVNYWKMLLTLTGMCLFLSAPSLSRNTFFHYTSGVSFGVMASILIILYVGSRFIPKKSASYAVLVFGYSFFLYILKIFWHHFYEIITEYMDYIIGYCIISAFASFLICYRLGPVTSQRTFNLIQWCMQAVSLLLVFFSSEYRELSTALMLVLLSVRIIPEKWIKRCQFLWYKCFPPKIKLLTELEYIEQGNKETKKALENLRQFCNSPDCNVWKVVKRLKDPTRFANFIENGSHYTDQELLEYNSEEFSSEYWDSEETEQNVGNGSLSLIYNS